MRSTGTGEMNPLIARAIIQAGSFALNAFTPHSRYPRETPGMTDQSSTPTHGRVEAIWIKRAKRGPMDPVSEAQAIAGRGLVGNADQGRKRQVTLIEREAWERASRELGAEIAPTARRANIMISGIPLENSRGKTLCIGNVRLRIAGETRPCERMNEAFPGLRNALDPHWRAGAFAEVMDDGIIRVGDEIISE
jgi:MOSC domain-containing protein YiiM